MSSHKNQAETLSVPFQELRSGLLAYLHQKVSNQAIAEDLLQDVFLKAIISSQNNALPKNIKSWIYTIAKNSVIDFYRAKKSTVPIPDDLISNYASDEREQQKLTLCLLPLVHQLTDIYRDTLIATDFENMPMKVIAEQSKLSISAIKSRASRASRARKMLKQKLLQCCHIELSVNNKVTDYQIRSQTKSVDCHNCD